jgi:hypothetical protein
MWNLEILGRFENYRKKILELQLRDPGFKELWADYIEIVDTLSSISSLDSDYVEYNRLQILLEKEIHEALQ